MFSFIIELNVQRVHISYSSESEQCKIKNNKCFPGPQEHHVKTETFRHKIENYEMNLAFDKNKDFMSLDTGVELNWD